MTENATRAAVYARVSTSDQSVERQLAEAREHLEREGVDDLDSRISEVVREEIEDATPE